MPEKLEAEHLLRDGVTNGGYTRTTSLFCEYNEVLFNMHVYVPSVVLYFDNYLHSAGI